MHCSILEKSCLCRNVLGKAYSHFAANLLQPAIVSCIYAERLEISYLCMLQYSVIRQQPVTSLSEALVC